MIASANSGFYRGGKDICCGFSFLILWQLPAVSVEGMHGGGGGSSSGAVGRKHSSLRAKEGSSAFLEEQGSASKWNISKEQDPRERRAVAKFWVRALHRVLCAGLVSGKQG